MKLFFFCFPLKVLVKGKQKYVEKKSRLSPDLIKRTVREIKPRSAGPVNISGVLTLLF